jgi:hypothetical protein
MSGSYCHEYYISKLETCYRICCIKLFGWQNEESTIGMYTPRSLLFADMSFAVMHVLLIGWLIYCRLKFVAAMCYSPFCSEKSFLFVFYKV